MNEEIKSAFDAGWKAGIHYAYESVPGKAWEQEQAWRKYQEFTALDIPTLNHPLCMAPDAVGPCKYHKRNPQYVRAPCDW